MVVEGQPAVPRPGSNDIQIGVRAARKQEKIQSESERIVMESGNLSARDPIVSCQVKCVVRDDCTKKLHGWIIAGGISPTILESEIGQEIRSDGMKREDREKDAKELHLGRKGRPTHAL